ncbi:MAG: LacI family DNA-binding transcriptional regulator [Chloroflexi bacterium]|nr:LacI family DNA-binding transcriptional regulator [Chloroflexota bacterium]
MAIQRLQKVTIKDIAKMCNVSTQTVSRVINNRPDVSPDTREAVEKAIAEMGYQPSALARSLVQQRSYTLGVIIAGLKYVGVSQTLNGITEQCEASGYALLIKELPRFDTSNIVQVIESLIAHHVEGIIFAAPELKENVKIAQAQLPTFCPPIIFLKSQATPNYATASVDNYGGARRAVEYLFSVGRHKVGLITGPLDWLEARQRKQGWEDALSSVGDDYEQRWTQGNWSSSSGESAFAELVQKFPDMDAVFVSNDQMALGVLHYTHVHGIRVPEDMAIIGFDDLVESAYYTPSLTTVTHPLRELGILGVKTILAQIEGTESRFSGKVLVLKTELVVRESTPKS